MLIGKKEELSLYKGLWLLILIFRSILVVHAQQPNIEFKPFAPLSDITSSKASVIVEDSVGYLWIGTEEGLYRFDGQTIYPYTKDPGNPRSLPSNGVINLVIDHDNNLWVGTKTGICKYNREYNDFSGLPDTSKMNGFNNCFIKTFTFNRTGQLFVAYNHVVYKYVQSQCRFVEVVRIDRGDISAMVFDDQDNLWIGNSSNGGLFCYDFRKKRLTSFLNDPLNNQSISSNEVKTLAISGHKLWIGTIGKGIDIYDFIDKKFKHYQFPGKLDNYINSIFISRDDKAWVCTLSNFKLYNAQGDYFYNYYHDVNNPYSVGRSLQGVYEDREGNLWNIHAFGGIRLARHYAPFKHNGSLADPLINSSEKEITAIAFDGSGQRWTFNPSLGLNIYNYKTGRSNYMKYDKNNPRGIADGVIYAIYKDSKNQVWLGSYIGGLKKYNPRTGDFDTWWHDSKDTLSIASNDIHAIAEDSKGNLWLAVHRVGVDCFDARKEIFTHYNSKNNNLCDRYTNHVFVDSRDNVWVGTAVGLSFLPNGGKVFKNYFHEKDNPYSISDNEVQVIYEDKKHRIWVGTNDGLNRFDPRTGRFTLYAAGLKKTRVSSILSDNHDNIWVATSTTISMLDTVTSRFINYNQNYGVHSKEFYDRSCAKDSLGNLYFGGSAGYDFFHPDSIKREDNNLKVILTDFKLFNQSISCRTDSQIIDKHISYAKKIFLRYFQNSIAFHYQAISLTDGHTIEYCYKLDGFDKKWVIAGKERIANYTNLNPGEYTFRVKAKYENGEWSPYETTIAIKVYPAWWMTIGFKIIMILVVIAFIYLYVYLRTKRLHHQREKLTELVAERTREIQSKKELLRQQARSLAEKNQQLNNQNATKDRLFSIISHDLRGPFNVILGFQNILVNEYAQCTEAERLDMVRKTYSTSQKVFNLVENLLNWARIQTSNIQYHPVALDVKKIITGRLDLYRDIAEAKGIHFSTTGVEQLVAYADSDILEAVLRNLVHNAIKFTPGGGSIHIRATRQLDEVLITVSDTGVGMTAEQLQSLFDAGKVETHQGTSGEKGSGLGLLLCKDFVEMNKGTIRAVSKWGKGSSFSFTIPLYRDPYSASKPYAAVESNEELKD